MTSKDDDLGPIRRGIIAANTDALEFIEESVPCHPDLPDVRTGYRLVRIAGMKLPSWVRMAYVHGRNQAGEYYYFVGWRERHAHEPHSYDVASEEEAKQAVLEELRRLTE